MSLTVMAETFATRDVLDFGELPVDQINLAWTVAGNSIEKVKLKDGKTEGLRLNWSGESKWIEFQFRNKPVLKKFQRIRAEIPFQIEAGTNLRRLTLRFVDSNDEVFQQGFDVDETKGLSQVARYEIDPVKLERIQTWPIRKDKPGDKIMDFPVRLMGMSIGYVKETGKGHVDLERIAFETEGTRKDFAPRIEIGLDAGTPIYILTPEMKGIPYMTIRNSLDIPFRGTCKLTISGYDGKIVLERNIPVELKPSTTMRVKLVRPSQQGCWNVEATLVNAEDDKDLCKHRMSFATMTPVGLAATYSHDDFRFGVCNHPDRYDDPVRWDREAQLMALAGMRYLRHGAGMRLLQKDLTLNTDMFDRITDAYAKHGVERVCCVGYATSWTAIDQEEAAKRRHTGGIHALEPNHHLWRIFCRLIFRHAKGKIKFWETWNEADLTGFCEFDAKAYLELARIAREELDRTNPDGVLMSSGFATLGYSEKANFQEEVMANAGDIFNIHCFHGHGSFKGYRHLIDDRFIPLRKRIGVTMPWYAHETALTSAGHGEYKQALALYKKLLFSWARGSIGYTWYNLTNKGTDPKNGEHNYGMVTAELMPKAVYVVHNALVALYGKPKTRFERQILEDGNLFLLQFKTQDESLLASWLEAPGEIDVLIKTDGTEVRGFDVMGNLAKTINPVKGAAIIKITDKPVTWQVDGAIHAVAKILDGPAATFAIPGMVNTVALVLHNPMDETKTIKLSPDLPDGLVAETDTISAELKPGETKQAPFGFSTDQNLKGKSQLLQFVASFDGLKAHLAVPIDPAVKIGEQFTEEPQFVLDSREHVYSRYDADPNNLDKLWSSPQDLSASIKLACKDEKLMVNVVVIDDLHRQDHPVPDIWRGDSVQIFLGFPGEQGHWQLGVALNEAKGVMRHCWVAPPKVETGPLASAFDATVQRIGTTTSYDIVIPLNILGGRTEADLKQGFRFNLMVNDDDLGVREGWISILPGNENTNVTKFPWIVLP